MRNIFYCGEHYRIKDRNLKGFYSSRSAVPLPSLGWNLLPIPSAVSYIEDFERVNGCRYVDLTDRGQVLYHSAYLTRSRNKWRLSPYGKYTLQAGGAVGGKRSAISEFSSASQSRLESKIEGYNVNWKSFITLTFRSEYFENRSSHLWQLPLFSSPIGGRFPVFDSLGVLSGGQDIKRAYLLMRAFLRHITECRGYRQTLKPPLFIWKKEFTSRGVVHFHILCTSPLKKFARRLERKWGELTNNDSCNSVDIQAVKKQRSIAFYISKYVSKKEKYENGFCCSAPLGLKDDYIGRWWGVVNARYWKSCIVKPVRFPLDEGSFKFLYRKFLTKARVKMGDGWRRETAPDCFITLSFFRSKEFDEQVGAWASACSFYDKSEDLRRAFSFTPFDKREILAGEWEEGDSPQGFI